MATVAVIVSIVVSYKRSQSAMLRRHVENAERMTALETKVEMIYEWWRNNGR